MKSDNILNNNSNPCQETIKPAHSVESYPVEANTQLFLNIATETDFAQSRAMSWAIDKIFKPKDYYSDMELIARQHEIVEGLKCQNGCEEYATECVMDTAINGMPRKLLVCQECADSLFDQWKERNL